MIASSYNVAMAIAQDAGNRHAKLHGRTSWNASDYAYAAFVFAEIWGIE